MAWESNLGDPSLYDTMPLPASPLMASGQDPDEVRAMMAGGTTAQMSPGQRALSAMKTVPPAVAPMAPKPAAPTAGAPASSPSPSPAGADASAASPGQPAATNWMDDAAREGLMGQLSTGRQLSTMNQNPVSDADVTTAEKRVLVDQAAAPNANNPAYKPNFGTRLLRGLKGVGLGFAEGGVFGALRGGLDPGAIAGGTAYGAPTDAYDKALEANKTQTAQDQLSLDQAKAAFQRATDARSAAEKTAEAAGKSFQGATTGVSDVENAQSKAAEVPIDQEKADTDKLKAQYSNPDGKLKATQAEIDQRTKLADQMRMPPGAGRTRYILTGEIQPERQATADEIAVNRVLGTWRQTHGGQGPQSVADWQSIYSAARGGTGRGGNQADTNLREAARIAAQRVKDLNDNAAKYGITWTDQEKQQHDQELQEAKNEAAQLQSQLTAQQDAGDSSPVPAASAAPASAAAPQNPNAAPRISPDGKLIFKQGKWRQNTEHEGLVHMRLPDKRTAWFTPSKAQAAEGLGAVKIGK